MKYSDNRGQKVAFVGNCILNQNVRAPGVAVKKGAFSELIQILLHNGIGIEQFSCPECLVWGGIRRKGLYKWQPLVFNSIGKWWFPALRLLIETTTFLTHGRTCKREGKIAAAWIQNHLDQGFEVIGVVTANDSPTCGVTKTLDLIDVMRRGKSSGMKLDDFENPQLEKMRPFMLSVLTDGSGAFARTIKAELDKRQLNVRVIGWDLLNDNDAEAVRIASLMGLDTRRAETSSY